MAVAFSLQLSCKRLQRIKHAFALGADRQNDAHAEPLWCVALQSKDGGIIVDAGIDEERVALAHTIVAGAKQRVDAAGLDVDARYLGSVVSCKYGELNCTTPGVWREDGTDGFIALDIVTRSFVRRTSFSSSRFFASHSFLSSFTQLSLGDNPSRCTLGCCPRHPCPRQRCGPHGTWWCA